MFFSRCVCENHKHKHNTKTFISHILMYVFFLVKINDDDNDDDGIQNLKRNLSLKTISSFCILLFSLTGIIIRIPKIKSKTEKIITVNQLHTIIIDDKNIKNQCFIKMAGRGITKITYIKIYI